ncbi:DNA primase [Streptomyces europaeiscabiei]|uniref:DNA primase n=1 Tax=Streptomyces europaeiscabiei TaxID=146819 RepID=A0ABU4NRD9_9ACTN|nr:bifunctional DNA primase/polymerase [Streptomyces europaeiscabiei]MDX3555295.1 DNA primase [Streptomyces europaeiscabiei]MDX3705309.1 DNA primase [Streptomyces europaeiscabiei]
MADTVCERSGCGAPLPVAGRGPVPRFCSTRCRVAAHRARRSAEETLPRELTARRRWVRRDERKAPRTTDGGFASVTAPATWTSYRDARATPVGVGLGYVLAEGDAVACIDLDHCLIDGELAPWARTILDRCPPTFVEVSPSGDGLHIWGRGEVERGRRIRRHGEAVEIYGQGRYVAVTGRRFEGCPAKLADISGVIASLI